MAVDTCTTRRPAITDEREIELRLFGRISVASAAAAGGGRFFTPLIPADVATATPTFRWDEHERVEFDVEDFLAAIHGSE